MLLGLLMLVLFVAAGVAVGYLVLQALGGRSARSAALEILRERCARGEIDLAEFEERRRAIVG